MNSIYMWYSKLSKQVRDSLTLTMTVIGLISTVCSILGLSFGDIEWLNIWGRICVVSVAFLLILCVAYCSIGKIFKNSVQFTVRNTPVSISCGDIFGEDGFRVIGCDTHFDIRIDDIVISKKSLHGMLFLEHGRLEEIRELVQKEGEKRKLPKNDEGLYEFPLGTIIRYDSSVDGQTYLLLAMTELDKEFKSRTNMARFELMLMKMWKEIDRVYASNDIVLPLLGTGISRFDDGPKEKDALLRCMLCTLNSSGVSLNANVKVVIYGNAKDIPLYEYRDMFHVIPGK